MAGNKKYYYSPRRNMFAVYEYTTEGQFTDGKLVKYCHTKEEAKAEVYRLNGWTIRPKQ